MLKKLYLHHFRNYEEKRLDFSASEIQICGRNGIGKTNILEAIHYLGILRSFKNASPREMVMSGGDSFTVMAQLGNDSGVNKIHIEQHKNGDRKCFINDVQEKRTGVLLKNFRPVIFAPEDRMIISGSAVLRRRFFDILISLESAEYLRDLQQYKHALAQRNSLLKKDTATAKDVFFAPFEELMAFHGVRIMQHRAYYADVLVKSVSVLSGDERFTIQYHPDWKHADIAEICRFLAESRSRDRLKGFTTSGVQLDDFDMFLDGFAMRNYASSGQTRLYSLYLKMAEFNLSCAGGVKPVALVDDVTGELDAVNCGKFYALLERAEQTFFTFTEARQLGGNAQIIRLGQD